MTGKEDPMDEERAGPSERMRHKNDGLTRRCGCARRKWLKCPHEFHFDYFRRGHRHRFPLSKVAGQPVAAKTEAEEWASKLRTQIDAGTFTDPNDPAPVIVAGGRRTLNAVLDDYIKRHVETPNRRPAAVKTMKWHIGIIRRTLEIGRAHV
jgi:hypothetical protein